MSTIEEIGKNISQAFDVVLKTYENLDLLFTEMDLEAGDAGFASILTPKFLRWKSDIEYSGWLINDFIKLYQLKNELSPADVSNNEIGSIYGVQINFEEEYPKIWLIRYTFDFSYWSRTPGMAENGPFYYALNDNSTWFKVIESNGILTGTLVDERTRKRFWGIHRAVGKSIPLLNVTSRDVIRSRIFNEMLTLPE